MSVLRALIPVHPSRPRRPAWLSRRALAVWWLAAAVVLLAFIGNPPVQRTQEARVLETAREMMGKDWQKWLVPRLNGDLRIRKPPLPYWLAVAGFKIGGINELAGRVPTAILGCFTLAVTFLIGLHLFGYRAGFFAAAALLTSYLFYRHTRLAETDAPAALFATCAVYAFLRAAGDWIPDADGPIPLARETDEAHSYEGNGHAVASNRARSGQTRWLCAGAAAAGMAFFSKGGPGLFPLFFLIGLAAVTRRWALLRRFFTSGAVALLLVGLSWYLYAAWVSGLKQFLEELHELSSGEDHGSPFYNYFPQVLVASAPWTGLFIVGLIEAIRRCRTDLRHRAMLVWIGATFVPLWFVGNKQFHYLMPMMPAVMVLVGWVMAAAVGDEEAPHTVGAGRAVLLITMVLGFVAVSLLPYIAKHEVHRIRRADVILCGGLLTLLCAAAWSYRAGGRLTGLVALLMSCATAMPLLLGMWSPSLRPQNTRAVADAVRKLLPHGPYRFYGDNFSITMCFNMRSEIHRAVTRKNLIDAATENPGLGVIAQTKPGHAAPKLADLPGAPVHFTYLGRIKGEDQAFDIYHADPVIAPAPGAPAALPAPSPGDAAGARP